RRCVLPDGGVRPQGPHIGRQLSVADASASGAHAVAQSDFYSISFAQDREAAGSMGAPGALHDQPVHGSGNLRGYLLTAERMVHVRSRGELLAVAPMMRTRAAVYGIKADAIQSIYNPHTPRFDFIVGNNQDPRLYEAIWREVTEHGDSEAIILTQIPDTSQTI